MEGPGGSPHLRAFPRKEIARVWSRGSFSDLRGAGEPACHGLASPLDGYVSNVPHLITSAMLDAAAEALVGHGTMPGR